MHVYSLPGLSIRCRKQIYLCVWGGGGVDLHGHKLMLTDRSQFMCTLVFCSLLPVVFILSCLSELNSHFHLKTKISPNVRSG